MADRNLVRSSSTRMAALITALAWVGGAQTPAASLPVEEPPPLYADYAEAHGLLSGKPTFRQMVKSREMQRFYRFLEAQSYTARAVTDGSWSAAATWADDRPPRDGDAVWIPADLRVTIEAPVAARVKLLRVDGTLSFGPDHDSRLTVETMAVTHRGLLQIGTADRRVAPDRTVEVVFADRGPRDRKADPFDITGGLIVTGRVRIFGAERASFSLPAGELRRGMREIPFERLPTGWRQGDLLLLPGTSRQRGEDERIAVRRVSPVDNTVVLDSPLLFDHLGPHPGLVPVGNLTRNVVFRSESPDRPSRRGHVMFMHTLTGIHVDGAGFYELGRTRARSPASSPKLDEDGLLVAGTDDNTVGRYAVHFHIRSGARRSLPANVVRGSAIVGSPKHGLVNHGGHVVAERNVSYDVAGSHFFSENGSELGRFESNLAVYSEGVEDPNLNARMYAFEFGQTGHGFWLAGGGIEVVDNYAFGHRHTAFAFFTRHIAEHGRVVSFPADNLLPEQRAIAAGRKRVRVTEVPFRATGNVAAASGRGLQVSYNQHWRPFGFARHDLYSEARDGTFWAMRGAPVFIEYSRNLALSDLTLIGDGGRDRYGVRTNRESSNVRLSRLDVRGFRTGVQMPRWGRNSLRESTLDNVVDVLIESATRDGRVIDMDDLEFVATEAGDGPAKQHKIRLAMREPAATGNGAKRITATDSVLGTSFQYDLIRLDDKQLYFVEQGADATPFASADLPELRGRTAGEIWRDYRLAVGGALAPADAVRVEGVHGLIGSVTPAGTLVARMHAGDSGNLGRKAEIRPDIVATRQSRDFEVVLIDGDGNRFEHTIAELREGWNVVATPTRDPQQHMIVFCDSRPPEFVPHARFPAQIHPDDLEYGIAVSGWKRDWLGSVAVETKMVELFDELTADDGVVHLDFPISDYLGNERLVSLRLQVSEAAARRGSSIDHYVEGPGQRR